MTKLVSLLTLIAIFSIATSSFAQKYGNTPKDSIDCIMNNSLYQEFYNQKNYTDAYEQWKNAQEEKSISLLIDIRDLDTLVINLRAGSLNELTSSEKPSEIVPEYGDMDQQDYPIERIEIPLK